MTATSSSYGTKGTGSPPRDHDECCGRSEPSGPGETLAHATWLGDAAITASMRGSWAAYSKKASAVLETPKRTIRSHCVSRRSTAHPKLSRGNSQTPSGCEKD